SSMFLGLSDRPWMILLLINLLLLAVGAVMDMTPAVLIFTPILWPVVEPLGMDPVHFGIMLIANLCIGLCPPPVGTCLFVGCSVGQTTIARGAGSRHVQAGFAARGRAWTRPSSPERSRSLPAPAPPLPPTDEDEVPPPVAPVVIELEVALPPTPMVKTPQPSEVNAISTEAELPTQTASMEEKTSEMPASKIPPSTPIAPLKPTFSGMAGKYTPPQLQAPTLPNPTEKERKAAQAAALAMQSIIEKEEVISETLADLLARQGHQEKAIQMYERLSLQFPQKSTYFAARIQKLKQP
ncbi:MAG TPA: TRAP transporter large permease subunit, partial [Saprospiraceae bacterium]|nr:TRAP transporter large permease subunit [Saprospiraceae bacterium]